jgi:vanillate O-demethylase monooxygenase subunit
MSSQRTRSYPVRELWNWIWIWLGDPELADEAPLPDHAYVHADDPEWVFAVGGVATLQARYMLLHDNILDLSHLTFLHQKTVGSPGIASAKVRTTDLPTGLDMLREVPGDSMEGSPLGAALGISGPVDRIMAQQYLAPCLHITGPDFRSAAEGGVSPGKSFGAFRVIHGIVPETPTSTHYFWGFTRNFRQQDDSMTEVLKRNILAAVIEDIDASEDIERMLESSNAPEEIHSPADAAGVKGRRMMQRLIDRESGTSAVLSSASA